ncbi:DUF2914 domain-containing protein [Desulfoferrobacter suflitae]|uniref:DUF2914 domain-containing protein n=1 Tax=Desulfoferrobacter suflitae TaxID=2865782 RepID=UPI00216408F2|nr:DUF2914 domain-containing protein [Desulfoferrobacter suflitae]MCK8600421.1 DUF2914 domain-containing protein [Desulfoferrobacter suflitae]
MRNLLGKLLIINLIALAAVMPLAAIQAQENGSDVEPAVQTAPAKPQEEPQEKLTLTQAFMCEKVENNTPLHQAVVFSVSSGQVCCFTSFDPVPQPTLIYHRWYHRDELSTQIRLRLYPPLWSTYSQIQLRETDKGPWRVEISDQNGKLFDVLRFSITD